MADKEATVYIVDVGSSMGERHQGRSVTDLEWGMQYVWDRITATVRFLSPEWLLSFLLMCRSGSYWTQDGEFGGSRATNRW